MADNVSMSEWPEHERKEWNVHRNIAGWALLMFCINRLFSRIDEWGLPQRAVYMVEIAVALAFFITIIAGAFARHNRFRHEVPWMVDGKGPLLAGVVIFFLYVGALGFQCWQN